MTDQGGSGGGAWQQKRGWGRQWGGIYMYARFYIHTHVETREWVCVKYIELYILGCVWIHCLSVLYVYGNMQLI